MKEIDRSIEVDLPVGPVYDQWTQFEEFPRFMEGVEEVRQLDDTRAQWVAQVAGARREWEAQIVEQRPEQTIQWRGFGDVDVEGTVRFDPVDADRTRVSVLLAMEGGALEEAAARVGVLDRRVEGDLERFKAFIEERGTPTGAWRGEIRDGRVVGEPTAGGMTGGDGTTGAEQQPAERDETLSGLPPSTSV